MKYVFSDAWILLSIIYTGSKEPTGLSNMISAADSINHAIPTFEETEGAMARLTAGGYIIENDGKLSPSEKTMIFYNSVTKPRRRVLTELEDVEKLLDISHPLPHDCRSANIGVSYPWLTRKIFNDAIGEYTERAKNILGRLLNSRKRKQER